MSFSMPIDVFLGRTRGAKVSGEAETGIIGYPGSAVPPTAQIVIGATTVQTSGGASDLGVGKRAFPTSINTGNVFSGPVAARGGPKKAGRGSKRSSSKGTSSSSSTLPEGWDPEGGFEDTNAKSQWNYRSGCEPGAGSGTVGSNQWFCVNGGLSNASSGHSDDVAGSNWLGGNGHGSYQGVPRR